MIDTDELRKEAGAKREQMLNATSQEWAYECSIFHIDVDDFLALIAELEDAREQDKRWKAWAEKQRKTVDELLDLCGLPRIPPTTKTPNRRRKKHSTFGEQWS